VSLLVLWYSFLHRYYTCPWSDILSVHLHVTICSAEGHLLTVGSVDIGIEEMKGIFASEMFKVVRW